MFLDVVTVLVTAFSYCAIQTVFSPWHPIFVVLPASYMRSLLKKDWRTAHQMVLLAVPYGVAEKFVQFCAGLLVNKSSRITLERIRKTVARKQWLCWLSKFSNEAYYVWLGMRCTALPRGAVPSGESTIAFMRANNRTLVHARLTKASRMSIAN